MRFRARVVFSRLCVAVAALTTVAVNAVVSPASHLTKPEYFHFSSKLQNNVNLRYVNNSGICETTPGVHTMSGYISVGTGMSMWFWFFAARNSPETAPFTLWLNGGPGCSSMIGLFQENGPCTVNPDGQSTTLNPYSWNNISNMIYIDQPIGTGFSYGPEYAVSTYSAAPFVWSAFQVLFESQEFSAYQSREFILATESYGGHYGPAFVSYFQQQNSAIASGTLNGVPVVVGALMINNGWIDPLIQNYAFISFATDAPGYGPLQSSAVIKRMNLTWRGPDGCEALSQACYAAGNSSSSNRTCFQADNVCASLAFLAFGDRDPYDLRQDSAQAFPPEYYLDYLTSPSVFQAIGAESPYAECSDDPYFKFVRTGDGARTMLPQLSNLVNSGLRILIWAGDTDIICNWLGNQAAVLAMEWYGSTTLQNTPLTNITLNGRVIAAVQSVDNFTFARVYEAGHEVPAFQPAASLELFSQVIGMPQSSSANDSYPNNSSASAFHYRKPLLWPSFLLCILSVICDVG